MLGGFAEQSVAGYSVSSHCYFGLT